MFLLNRHRAVFASACAIVFTGTANLACGQLANVEQQVITFTNNLAYEGKVAFVPELGTTLQNLEAGNPAGIQIMLIDDGLRRRFLYRRRDDIANITPVRNPPDEFTIDQPESDQSGSTASQIGQILRVGPFDDWGRRRIMLQTNSGPAEFTQGITKITPHFCEVEVLRNNVPNTPKLQWKMNISTAAVPVEVIRKVLLRQIDPKNFDDRLRIVRFLTQGERFRHAKIELATIAKDFPGLEAELMQQYELLMQAETSQSLREIRTWKASGNTDLSMELLELLRKRARLSSDALAEINDIHRQVAEENQQLDGARKSIADLVEQIRSTEGIDSEAMELANWMSTELAGELNLYNLNRLASFLRLESDESLAQEKKLALAVSGWIVGSNNATDNLALASSLHEAKPLVEQYLKPALEHEREEILRKLSDLEAGDPIYISQIVELMLPPVAVDLSQALGPEPMDIKVTIPVPGGRTEPGSYLVQLPPGYNPYRKYPCIVTLNGINTTPQAQISWWAGDYSENLRMRRGMAARNGYIVIAPNWMNEGQLQYEYTAQEHARVLSAYRSALRSFSIDTDRVFLTGHYQGGDAAWDIGVAHPDHWAGVIPISADADKYVKHYNKNARYVPFYSVYGERDILARDKNSSTWNRYLKGRDYDTFIVEFKGRGAEDFYEEIVNLYDWMNVKRRRFHEVKTFECSTMRNTDNYFWWYEVHGIRDSKLVHPHLWDLTKSKSDLQISFKVNENRFILQGHEANATIWLSPDLVDFSQRIRISDKFNDAVQPSTRVLLEDVRRRADRQHPFWAKIDLINNRWEIVER